MSARLSIVAITKRCYTRSRWEVVIVMTPDTQLFQDVFNASPIGIVVETLEGQLFLSTEPFAQC